MFINAILKLPEPESSPPLESYKNTKSTVGNRTSLSQHRYEGDGCGGESGERKRSGAKEKELFLNFFYFKRTSISLMIPFLTIFF